MSKSKSKSKAPKATKSVGKAAGVGSDARTPRMRFVERPSRALGNPFFAVRVPKKLLSAFRAHAKKVKANPNDLVRAFMSSLTGVPVHDDEGDEGAEV